MTPIHSRGGISLVTTTMESFLITTSECAECEPTSEGSQYNTTADAYTNKTMYNATGDTYISQTLNNTTNDTSYVSQMLSNATTGGDTNTNKTLYTTTSDTYVHVSQMLSNTTSSDTYMSQTMYNTTSDTYVSETVYNTRGYTSELRESLLLGTYRVPISIVLTCIHVFGGKLSGYFNIYIYYRYH